TRALAQRPRQAAGRAGARAQDGTAGQGKAIDSAALIAAVQAEVFPTERNWTRRADLLEDSLSRLDAWWRQVRHSPAPGDGEEDAVARVRTREAIAMLATARWMYRSALARPETRGMARRADHPAPDPAWGQRLLSGGLDEVWTRPQPVAGAARHAYPEAA
ncbi:MAG: pyridine nucleotide-disulfide oxidoreductase, partial [Comamonas sp.]